ncbi:hypothetical protein [Nocardioides pantholopis]|uniref:hypothetical protein n=1 Tax=Nocardioides pantholopis TaxID=2483798 RepID=UPI000F07D2B1|nr:hypothetical protein [Nocardioides pantholopis]
MSDPRPERVRVTGPARRRTPPPRTRDIDADTRLGGIYLGSLLRDQLALAARVLLVLAGCVGMLPLLFHLAPGLAEVHVAGLPLAWLLLGLLVYPLLVGLGWWYVRRAERNEQAFAELLREADE